ncbi:hypothetical protein KM1_320290 [Entamoeba histolytica HM-3:IMSS]|uniref:TLDc domain-containing protein n=1 Tax=Entamoeba histolytica HM-3:IMSS TaxID=885315 RepID=M7WP27_ENTHI|nr:hypothetical protein KM1_320290 [Entamoeba histolytica HM-3:IMSS]
MEIGGKHYGAFREEEIVHMQNLMKIIENGANNEFVTISLFKILSSMILKLNLQMMENEKTKREQLEEIVGAVNFLKSRVDESNEAVQSIINEIPKERVRKDPIIEMKTLEAKESQEKQEVKGEIEINIRETLESFGIGKEIEEVKEWIGKKEYHTIYDSSVDGLTSYGLNDKICGKKNVMVFIKTSDEQIIGTYSSVVIPTPSYEGEYCFIRNDKEFFILKKEGEHMKRIIKRERAEKSDASLMIHCSMDDVFYVSRAFCIKTKGSFVLPGISQEYEIEDSLGDDYLVGTHDPSKFEVKKMYAIEWN